MGAERGEAAFQRGGIGIAAVQHHGGDHAAPCLRGLRHHRRRARIGAGGGDQQDEACGLDRLDQRTGAGGQFRDPVAALVERHEDGALPGAVAQFGQRRRGGGIERDDRRRARQGVGVGDPEAGFRRRRRAGRLRFHQTEDCFTPSRTFRSSAAASLKAWSGGRMTAAERTR